MTAPVPCPFSYKTLLLFKRRFLGGFGTTRVVEWINHGRISFFYIICILCAPPVTRMHTHTHMHTGVLPEDPWLEWQHWRIGTEMLRGAQKGSESMRFHLLGTLFSFALSQGFGCASVSGVRAGYYFIVMKEKRCRWEQQRWWQKISPLGKMLQEQRHIVSSTENHVLLLGIARFGGQWWTQEAERVLPWW